jgi:hypothetical protein
MEIAVKSPILTYFENLHLLKRTTSADTLLIIKFIYTKRGTATAVKKK